ncbi:MAG: hypothetical protein ACP5OZ_01860 [Candidatus Woesearchaeota archaeon]
MGNFVLKVLGVLDLAVAIVLSCSTFLSASIVKQAGIYLLLKGVLFSFSGDIASILDILSAIYIIVLSFGISSPFISIIVFVYLLQKALYSIVT